MGVDVDELLSGTELPNGFTYPSAFRRVVSLGLVELDPWFFLDGPGLRERLDGIRQRYRHRVLVPFARRGDNDDVACWDLDLADGSISVIHDYASSGWEQKEQFSDFAAWFRQAVDDMLEFE